MAIESISTIAPEKLTELLTFIQNGIAALGGLLTAYIIIYLWKLWISRKNHHLLLSIHHDLGRIKKKLKIK